jgi:hypothetical protein
VPDRERGRNTEIGLATEAGRGTGTAITGEDIREEKRREEREEMEEARGEE